MGTVFYLDAGLMEAMCYEVARRTFDRSGEPLPPFARHDHALLDSALNVPRASFGGKELYPTLVEKAAMLYYVLNRNHPFQNGNKRIATASLLVFLFINGYWLKTNVEELFAMTLSVARSKAEEKTVMLRVLNDWLRPRVTPDEEAQATAREIRALWELNAEAG